MLISCRIVKHINFDHNNYYTHANLHYGNKVYLLLASVLAKSWPAFLVAPSNASWLKKRIIIISSSISIIIIISITITSVLFVFLILVLIFQVGPLDMFDVHQKLIDLRKLEKELEVH